MDEETIKLRKLQQAEKYYNENRKNSLLIAKVNQYLLNEHIFVVAKGDNGEVLKLIPQAIEDENNASVMVLNLTDYERLNTKMDASVVVIYDPLDCGINFHVNANVQQEFFNFIEMLTSDKITRDMLPTLFSHWISEINSKDNITDSLAFCLLTGRRLYRGNNVIDKKPFIEFLYPKVRKESNKSDDKTNDDWPDDVFDLFED